MEEMVQETIVVEKQPAMTQESLEHLKSGAAWAKFLSIVNFVCCGLAILFGILFAIMAFLLPTMHGGMAYGAMAGLFPPALMGAFVFMAGIYIVMGAIGFIMAYFLYKFAEDAKIAVLHKDTAFLTGSMSALKKYFKITGILTIVTLSMSVVWIAGMMMTMVC